MAEVSRKSLMLGLALLGALACGVFGVRLLGPPDLLDNDQLRPAAYALDVVVHDRWIVQTDYGGDIASKPPLYTWLVSLASLPSGRVTLFTLYLPCAAAVASAAMLVFAAGRRVFGDGPAFAGAAMVVLSAYGFKHVALARTDALFMATVTLTALLALRAWSMGAEGRTSRGSCTHAWTLAWTAAALATLTKGPLGLVLGAMGLIALVWERRSGRGGGPRGAHWMGLTIYLLLCGGWFVAAYASAGQPFLDKVIGRELLGHVVGASKEQLDSMPRGERIGVFFAGLVKPTAYLMTRFAPWSLLAVLGVWRVVRAPGGGDRERRFERFITCWLLGGLVLFSVMPHQRADLLLPLVPAAALLAGREAARVIERLRRGVRIAATAAVGVVAMAACVYEYHVRTASSKEVVRTAEARAVAEEVRAFVAANPGVRVMDVDASGGVQFFLGMKEPRVTADEAFDALSSDRPVVVLTRNPDEIPGADAVTWRTVSRQPATGGVFAAAITNVPSEAPAE